MFSSCQVNVFLPGSWGTDHFVDWGQHASAVHVLLLSRYRIPNWALVSRPSLAEDCHDLWTSDWPQFRRIRSLMLLISILRDRSYCELTKIGWYNLAILSTAMRITLSSVLGLLLYHRIAHCCYQLVLFIFPRFSFFFRLLIALTWQLVASWLDIIL